MKIFIGLLGLLLITLIGILRMLYMSEVALENQLVQTYMQSMQEMYQIIQERIEATRRYRHDLAKHIQTLEILLENQEEENENMQAYKDNLIGRMKRLRKTEFCEDDMINSILSAKKLQCDRKKIPFQIEIENTYYEIMQEIDLVAFLHNLLENAIEANERIPESGQRGILCSIGKNNNEMWIKISNYICSDEEIDFVTKKLNKEEHGMGRKIIDDLMRKYAGKRCTELDDKRNMLHETYVLKKTENYID